MRPQFIDYEDLDTIKTNNPKLIISDQIDLAITELFDIKYPQKKDTKTDTEVDQFKEELIRSNKEDWGNWVYYDWIHHLVHFPPKKEHRMLRTSRNRNLVTEAEQKSLYKSTICIAGLSVGSNVVEALVSQGIGGRLILTDMDIIEPSNLNRIRSPYYHVGVPKTLAIARKAWEIDPYLEIEIHDQGLNSDMLAQFKEDLMPTVMIDEVDDLRAKVLIREFCKTNKLPVVMAADDGDNSLVDIERYDQEPDQPIFFGRVPSDIVDKIKHSTIERQELGKIIGQYFIGEENIPVRMLDSLKQVGKTLPSWPQLGGAAALSGIAVAYIVKQIILGNKVSSKRALVSLDKALGVSDVISG